MQKLFAGKFGAKKRVPIDRRAAQLGVVDRFEEARLLYMNRSSKLDIGSNTIEVILRPLELPFALFHSLLSCFTHITEQTFMYFWFYCSPDQLTECVIQFVKKSDRYENYPSSQQTLYLDFKFNPQGMNLSLIKADKLGGRALAALYNFAVSQGLGTIQYFVSPFNHPARQFYFHTDFGWPLDENMEFWRVEIKE